MNIYTVRGVLLCFQIFLKENFLELHFEEGSGVKIVSQSDYTQQGIFIVAIDIGKLTASEAAIATVPLR